MQWKAFKVDIKALNQFLIANVPKSNGIVAYEDYFEIIETEPFDQADLDLINNYYDQLTQSGEELKLTRNVRLWNAAEGLKLSILTKNYNDMTAIERKLLMRIPLTVSEENDLLGE